MQKIGNGTTTYSLRNSFVAFSAFMLTTGCSFYSMPANQANIECDVISQRAELLEMMESISSSKELLIDFIEDPSEDRDFIASLSNISGNIMIGHIVNEIILIDKQETPFVDTTDEEIENLRRASEELVSSTQAICR